MTTWMLVEDEPDLYDMVLAMYSMIGVRGEAFPDGESAVEWIEQVDAGKVDGELPELSLIDIRLPGDTSGLDVGERLRQSPRLRDMVIVLITGFHMNPHEERAAMRQTQADALVYKPLPGFAEFRQQLETLLRQRNKSIAEQPTTSNNGSSSPKGSPPAKDVPYDRLLGALFGKGKKKGNDPLPPDILDDDDGDNGYQ